MTHCSVSLLAPTRQERYLRWGGSTELLVKAGWQRPANYNKEAPRCKTSVVFLCQVYTDVSVGAGFELQHLQVALMQEATVVTGPPVSYEPPLHLSC